MNSIPVSNKNEKSRKNMLAAFPAIYVVWYGGKNGKLILKSRAVQSIPTVPPPSKAKRWIVRDCERKV
jgi:hypothetical protein